MWKFITNLVSGGASALGGWPMLILYGIVATAIAGVVWRYFYLERKVDEQKTTISVMEGKIATLGEQMKEREKEAQEIKTAYDKFYGDQNAMNLRLQKKIGSLQYGLEAIKNPVETQTKLNADFNRVLDCIEKMSQGTYDEALCN